jgi:hypothetical protein
MYNHVFYAKFLIVILAIYVFPMIALADTIVLKDGKVLQGTFKGGTDEAIIFEIKGQIKQVAIQDITSLTFSPRGVKEGVAIEKDISQDVSEDLTHDIAQDLTAIDAAMVAKVKGPVTVPVGTSLMIKVDKAFSTASHQVGSKITGVLDIDLVVDGKVIAPKGSQVYGKVLESIGGRRVGNQKIVFQFTDLMINNQLTPIKTDPLGAEGGRGRALRTIAGAALIGGGIDGNKGAKTGTLIGAGAAVLAGGNNIEIPEGALAEVPLNAAITIK